MTIARRMDGLLGAPARSRSSGAIGFSSLVGVLACLAFALGFSGATTRADTPAAESPPKSSGTRRALVVCGLPGDDEHRTLYAGAVEAIRKALVERHGFPASEVWVRFGTEGKPGDGPALASTRGLSDRAGIEADVAEIRKTLAPEDTLWVIVLGHGHYDGRHAHLNLPGPDVSDEAFGKLFEGLKARDLVFWITTSSSGFFLKPLSAPGRVVITATEPDQEVNETLFPLALADVLATPPDDADRDKDGSISVLELYLAVVTNVMKRYVEEENLPTEHARIDDNGDGHGSEPQLAHLPPELGGQDEPKGKGKRGKETSKPTIGPKDDGALASKLRLDPAPAKTP